AQDCSRGQKCMPFTGDNDLGFLGHTHCVPVSPNPKQADDVCVISGSENEPEDDCGVGLFCWYGDGMQGICAPLCSGSPSDPQCPEDSLCVSVLQSGTVNLCYQL